MVSSLKVALARIHGVSRDRKGRHGGRWRSLWRRAELGSANDYANGCVYKPFSTHKLVRGQIREVSEQVEELVEGGTDAAALVS